MVISCLAWQGARNLLQSDLQPVKVVQNTSSKNTLDGVGGVGTWSEPCLFPVMAGCQIS